MCWFGLSKVEAPIPVSLHQMTYVPADGTDSSSRFIYKERRQHVVPTKPGAKSDSELIDENWKQNTHLNTELRQSQRSWLLDQNHLSILLETACGGDENQILW